MFPVQQADESLSFEDQILGAAKSITAAIGTLVKAATQAQKELVAKGSVSVLLNLLYIFTYTYSSKNIYIKKNTWKKSAQKIRSYLALIFLFPLKKNNLF